MRQSFKQFCNSIKNCSCCEYTFIRKSSECEKLFNKEHSNKPKESNNKIINLDNEIKRISSKVKGLYKLYSTAGNDELLSTVIAGYESALLYLDNCKQYIDEENEDEEVKADMTKYHLNEYKDIINILEFKEV